ncbi:hypothetical protein JB92DRAFT_536783 [Gautieria morchelliformis]|nr:hypothetical protein JB92DRAFT_536783 [Gautieria morchelliformis]
MPSLFQSISSFFTSQRDTSHLRRDQAMVSVDDAFTVPPGLHFFPLLALFTHTSCRRRIRLQPHRLYLPSCRPGRTQQRNPFPSGIAPSPSPHALIAFTQIPPLQQTWNRLRTWLDEQYPELADTLNWGIQPPDLAHLELQLGFALPQAVRESYLIVDGQEAESSAGCSEGLFFGLTLLPFEDVVDEWRFWREVDDDPATGANAELREDMQSIPPGWIRREYCQRGWLPLVADKGGNYIGVDMNPDERGSVGQVIIFGRDFDTKVVMWRGDGEGGWARWLASFVEELEGGEGFEVGVTEASEGSEDEVGYESYFFDGSTAKGQGADSGGGGLRLTGEYRGWTVLEAFADRSMRRWIEAGVMPQPTTVDEAGPSSNVQLAARDPEPGPSSGISQSQWSSTSPPNGDPSSSHSHAPSLSITKLPAPLPVQLPTEQDLLPSPYSSPTETTPVYDAGHEEEFRMREVGRTTPVQANYPASVKEAMLVPLPPSNSDSPSKPLSPVSTIDTQSEPPNFQTPDNFDSQNLLSASSPVDSSPLAAAIDVPSSTLLTHTPFDLSEPDSDPNPCETPAATEDPQPSVRLVGSGGTAGDALLVDGIVDIPDASGLSKKNSLDMSGSNGKRKTEAAA